MATETTHCPIWGDPFPATVDHAAIRGAYLIVDSPRAGGRYQVSKRARPSIDELDDHQKARLTTLLVDARRRGTPCPEVDTNTIDTALDTSPLSVTDRAERLLLHFAMESQSIGAQLPCHQYAYLSFAWTESVTWDEVRYFRNYLAENQWVHLDRNGKSHSESIKGKTHHIPYAPVVVTVAGYRRVSDRDTSAVSSQAFVAIWFDESMDVPYAEGIRPGIRDAGYTSLRIDQKPDVNKIDDEIIAEIRRSRFLVADFTHGDDGARGGVYYEAGFAHGLGLPVIFSCHKDIVENLHFDTRQYHHIVWETPEELRESLSNRILALIGEDPGKDSMVT